CLRNSPPRSGAEMSKLQIAAKLRNESIGAGGRIGMKRHTFTMFAFLTLGAAAPLSAQDVTITNARIIAANGTVIERGSIVVRAGKIVSVTPGGPTAASGATIDAKGMTAMPGFIDAHRPITTGPSEKAQMQSL